MQRKFKTVKQFNACRLALAIDSVYDVGLEYRRKEQLINGVKEHAFKQTAARLKGRFNRRSSQEGAHVRTGRPRRFFGASGRYRVLTSAQCTTVACAFEQIITLTDEFFTLTEHAIELSKHYT